MAPYFPSLIYKVALDITTRYIELGAKYHQAWAEMRLLSINRYTSFKEKESKNLNRQLSRALADLSTVFQRCPQLKDIITDSSNAALPTQKSLSPQISIGKFGYGSP